MVRVERRACVSSRPTNPSITYLQAAFRPRRPKCNPREGGPRERRRGEEPRERRDPGRGGTQREEGPRERVYPGRGWTQREGVPRERREGPAERLREERPAERHREET
jgi:hypothetical protein